MCLQVVLVCLLLFSLLFLAVQTESVTFETFDQSDEETWPYQKKHNDKDKYQDKDNDKDKYI